MDTTTIPPCDATGPDGSRLVIHPHAPTDSMADLARALDLPASTALAIDGRPVRPHDRLLAAGLRIGSAVTVHRAAVDEDGREAGPTTGALEVAVAAGPACERWVRLPPGRHTVGRARSADVRIDDPAVELHHGVIDVASDGTATFTQLTGRCPVMVDGEPCNPGRPFGPDRVMRVGSSRLLVGSTQPTALPSRDAGEGSVVPAERDPWRRVVRRAPVPPAVVTDEVLHVPEAPPPHRPPPATSLVGAGVAATGAGLMAAVLGQALFALFAAVGAVASLATWAVGWLVARRDRRRSDAAHRSALAAFGQRLWQAHGDAERDHRRRHRSVVDALELAHGAGRGVWSRRCGSGDAMWATIGRGTCRWDPPIAPDGRARIDADLIVTVDASERLVDVPVPLALESSSVVAFHGPITAGAALARSVIVQLATTYGPADWELLVVTRDADRWAWVSWLPHARRPPVVVGDIDPVVFVADPADGRRLVVVLDAPAVLTTRTGPLRRRLERGDASCIVVVPADASVPAVVERTLELGHTGTARWIEHSDDNAWACADAEIHVAGISTSTAEAAARQLAPLIDPEDRDGAAGPPSCVSLAQVEHVATDAPTVIARRWMTAGRDPAPVARLGMSGDGLVDIDLVRDGPHGLIAGTTGSGKSELLRTLVVSLAAQVGPDHVSMILIDFKGGSTFDACARLPHTVGVVTDLDEGLAERVLVSLDAEVRRRERLLRAAGVEDLAGYRRTVDEPLPRLVVVVDEFASLARELPDVLSALVAIAQRGRSLGVHLLLATQRPAGVVTDDIRANTNLRVALRLQDRGDSCDVVGDDVASRFAPGTPGRAALRLGPEELVVFQTATTSVPVPPPARRLRVEWPGDSSDPSGTEEPSVLEHLVEAICAAATMVGPRTEASSTGASRTGATRTHRPWIDPLPSIVRRGDVEEVVGDVSGGEEGVAVGLVDDPANQRRLPLVWTPADGNLLLVGAAGTGTTTAAATVAAACVRSADPAGLHVYVIDAQGGAIWARLGEADHCGAVVRVVEVERLLRLLGRLTDELERRRADGTREPVVVVVIDGYAALRDTLDRVALGEAATQLDRLLRDGPSRGIVAVVTTDGLSSGGLAVPRSATWVLHVADPGGARTAGLRTMPVAAGVPGRLRVAESGLEAQMVLDPHPFARLRGPSPGAGAPRPGPAEVRVLPAHVDPAELDARASRHDARSADEPVELILGLRADDLEPAVLRVPVGDHVFIGGAARTGCSTALRQVEAAWRRAHPDGDVVHLDGRDGRRRIAAGLAMIGDLVAAAVATTAPAGHDPSTPVLVVVDGAERVDDPDGLVATLVSSHRAGVTVAVAARLEAVRVAYGHWTRDVARSRCGLVMTSPGDVDGELLGAVLPRRSMIPPRPGLAWMVDQGGHRLVQVAGRMPG